VAFCIQCGARNGGDAIFCASCGQRLYHEPNSTVAGRTHNSRRYGPFIAVPLIISVAILIVLFSIRRGTNPTSNSAPANSEALRPKAPAIDAAVLTIVGTNARGSPIVQGSGFILSSDGLGGSNYHVLRGTAEAFAGCCNGRIFEIRAIEGADLVRDLVVFQLYERGNANKPQNLPHVTLGSSKDLVVGDRVIAVGSPKGLENTVSDGILSAVREDESTRYLQITAPISPGSSGGPVLDSKGQMVGVATSQLEGGQNLNFAVAVEYLRPLLDQHYEVSLTEFQSIVAPTQRNHQKLTDSKAANDSPAVSPAPNPPLTGQFDGIVHNETAGVSAAFVIVENDDGSGDITGCMGVRQPLFGSGALAGFATGSDVSFVVTSAIGKITFIGQRHNKEISGTYLVEHESSPAEEGTFTLSRVNRQGLADNFDTANCPTDAEFHK
jgi:S1-C subfamily serine protease